VAYQEELSKHRMKLSLYDLEPRTENAWIAPNATLIGEVIIRRWATVWYNSVIRGDINRVEVSNFSSIGDNSVVHTAASLPTGMSAKVYIGSNVTIGSGCTLYSCHIEDDVFIGDRCVILEGARVEKSAMLAPGSVVPPGRLIPAKQLWAGNPVEFVKDLTLGEIWSNYSYSYVAVSLGDAHRNEFTQWASNYLKRESNLEDVELRDDELDTMQITKNVHRGVIKYYA
jgi:carbonic anhydrase/acetyltransferase-like protein (isoleucine patch superfamily)